MSDTPRTDANLEEMVSRTSVYAPSVEFTRQLERELAAMEQSRDYYREMCLEQEARIARLEGDYLP